MQQYIYYLAPSFRVDYLLPRTLLSVMSLEHIEQVFKSMVFPPDACLANVFYFVNTEQNLDQEVCNVVWNLIKQYTAHLFYSDSYERLKVCILHCVSKKNFPPLNSL